ncbi:MAG TPA: oligosaccharide flippase family protein [Candidatus Angelobacter sp.]|jgi:O-antigen/teichoic acid export membrane protein|nr:oligosaccharide flippase family protein [Candidatus Angelobacter sp.]
MSAIVASPAAGIAVNAGWLATAQVVRRLLRLCVLLLIAHLISIESFGVYALLLTVVELIALVSGFSYGDFLTREIAKDRQAAWPLAKRITQIRFAYSIPCIAVAVLLLAALRFPRTLILNAALLSLTLAPRIVGDSAQGVMKGLLKFRPLLWVELAQGAVMLSVAPLLIGKGFGLRGAIAAEVLAAAAGAVIAVLAIIPTVDFKATHPHSFRMLARSILAFNVYPFIATIYDRVDIVLLSKLAGDIATALYSVPYRVFASFSIIPYGMMGALLPVFSAAGVTRETRDDCRRAMKFLYLIALQAVLMVLAFARPAILALLGERYSGSIITIRILAWAAIPVFLNHALNILLLAAHKEKIFVWTASICTVFNISVNLLLIPRFSFTGAAAATLLTELLLLAQNCYLVRRFLGEFVFPKDSLKTTLVFLLAVTGFLALRNLAGEIIAGTIASAAFASFAVMTGRGLSALISAKLVLRCKPKDQQRKRSWL